MSSHDVHYTSGGISRASSRVILQNLLVLTAPDGGASVKQRRGDVGDARHDRPPGPDDELGVAEQPVVPRAAPDRAVRARAHRASRRSRPSSAADSRPTGEPDRRRLPGEPPWVATGTSRSFRVLLSGPAADRLAPALDREPGFSMLRVRRPTPRRGRTSPFHALASSSDPNVAEEVRRLREVADAPLILAAYGEPNGIVETGLAVGAADVLILPQPTETLLFALRKAAIAPRRPRPARSSPSSHRKAAAARPCWRPTSPLRLRARA